MPGFPGSVGGVIRIPNPRLAAATVSLGVGLVLLAVTPSVPRLEKIDRTLFGRLAGKGNAVLGSGSVEDPRRTETLAAPAEIEPAGVLLLDEDPGGFFEKVPPPPADVAVVLARLQARGLPAFGFGYPLQWDDADTLAVEAMRRVMDRFDGAVLGFPLKDSTAGDPVAAPFQLASVSYGSVAGDATDLPVVNAIRGVAPELGGNTTRAGFTRLESEKEDAERAYLLARWGDRVVFALPVVVEVARLGLTMDQVRVEVGTEIRLGQDGPRIPIDFRGRADLPKAFPELRRVPATTVISDQLPEGFATGKEPLYFGDGRLLAPKADREWVEQLAPVDAAVRGAPQRTGVDPVPRPQPLVELVALVVLALVSGRLLSARHLELRTLCAVGLTALVALGLGAVIRTAGVAPVPLAFGVVPGVAWLTGEISRWSNRVEIVTVREPEPDQPVAKKEAARKSRRGRRKRKR